ncbi:hypothetical protein GEMRC1_002671 [Eukaryota sp. GEM-RC1]
MVACLVNGLVNPLSAHLSFSASVQPVFCFTSLGTRIYRATLMFLLAAASHTLFPSRRLIVSHSVGEALYYYYHEDSEISSNDIDLLNERVTSLVLNDFPIVQETLSFIKAVDLFTSMKRDQTVALLNHLNDPLIKINRMVNVGSQSVIDGDYIDLVYFETVLASSTGVCQSFLIEKYRGGLLLRFPTSGTFSLAPFFDNLHLYNVYEEYNFWGRVLGVDSVASLNSKAMANDIKHFILVCEALHDQKIGKIAENITERFENGGGLVLISGPSSSGKTTCSFRLEIALRARGRQVVTFNLDSFYLPRAETPLDEEGNYDYESVYALDLPLLRDTVKSMISGAETAIPDFDFKTGLRVERKSVVVLPKNGVLLMEGLHALNPILFEGLEFELLTYKIFISPLSQLNVDDNNRISTSDTRLCRRLVRDFKFRGNDAETTFKLWPRVVAGEHQWIYAFQDQADIFFNSALDYEFCVMKTFALPLLHSIKPTSLWYSEARRMISFLSVFHSISMEYIPFTSLLREFLGSSWFDY